MNDTNESQYQLLDYLATAVLLFDKHCKLYYINDAGEDLLSLSIRRIKGYTPDKILPHAAVFTEIIKRTQETSHPYTERGVVLPLDENHSITVDCRITPVNSDDALEFIIVELIDVYSAQRVYRDENLALLHDAARDSLRGMAHEIRNPLGGIRGAAQLLEQELDDDELTEYTRIIIRESDRLRNFIDSMLMSDHQLYRSRINVHELIERITQLLNAEYKNKVEIQKDYDPSLPDLYIDQEKVMQALLNVLRNAIQAAGPQGEILVRTRAVRKFTIRHQLYRLVVRIDVIDDGPGVAEEIQDRIFYPLITNRAEGTGLGLSIAQSLINLNEGIIEYERKNDQTCFSIYLPVEYD